MSQWEYEQRCRLEDAYKDALDKFEQALETGRGDPFTTRERMDRAQAELDAWDDHVIQISAAPLGMVAVFERRDGLEEVIPVSYIALHRSGRVAPYLFMGNCQPKCPPQFASFLRIDFRDHMDSKEAVLTEVSKNETEPVGEDELWRE